MLKCLGSPTTGALKRIAKVYPPRRHEVPVLLPDVDGQPVGQFYKETSCYLVTQSVFLRLLRMQGFGATLMVKSGLIR